jgi:hypothetical protein
VLRKEESLTSDRVHTPDNRPFAHYGIHLKLTCIRDPTGPLRSQGQNAVREKYFALVWQRWIVWPALGLLVRQAVSSFPGCPFRSSNRKE